MIEKINIYDEKGNVKWVDVRFKNVDVDVAIPEKELIGEVQTFPTFEDVLYPDTTREFILLALRQLREGKKLNLLFAGFKGCGKTFSAKMIATETGRPMAYLMGSMGSSRIIDMLSSLRENCIVLIDEVHNMTERVAEIIYPAIEYGEFYVDGKRVKLAEGVIFIGTTTEAQKLPAPLLDRFFRIEFNEPDKDLLWQLLDKMSVPRDVKVMLTAYTQNLRVIKKLLGYVKMYGEVNIENLKKVFKMMKINMEVGLGEEQIDYLRYLKLNGRSALRNVGLYLRRSEDYVKMDIEPELIRKSLILVSSRGREINEAGMSEYLLQNGIESFL